MKNLKKISAALIVIVMIFAFSVSSLADNTSSAIVSGTNDNLGKIIIDGAVNGEEYSLYQIFVLESYSYNEETKIGSYSYKIASGWSEFFSSGTEDADAGDGLTWVDVSDDGYVTWKSDMESASELQKFAAAALKFAKEKGIAATKTSAAAEGVSLEFTGLNLGYYLVTSSVGTLCSLDTTNKEVTIKEKNPMSSIEKGIVIDDKGTLDNINDDITVKSNSYNIGDKVPFQLKVTVSPSDTSAGGSTGSVKQFIIHDKMSSGLTLDADTVKVYKNGTEVTTGYTYKDTGLTDNITFEIVFDEGAVSSNDVIVVTYSATLNENAVTGVNGNPNTAELTYGKDQKDKDEVKVYTAKIIIDKYDGADADKNTKLGGAKFVLRDSDSDTAKYYKFENNKVKWVDNSTDATEITTGDDGAAEFTGLKAGTYYLEETAAPEGFNKLTSRVAVTIGEVDETTSVTLYKDVVQPVANSTGTEFPSTGGIGTVIFVTIGSFMLITAGVLLVTKRRMNIIGN